MSQQAQSPPTEESPSAAEETQLRDTAANMVETSGETSNSTLESGPNVRGDDGCDNSNDDGHSESVPCIMVTFYFESCQHGNMMEEHSREDGAEDCGPDCFYETAWTFEGPAGDFCSFCNSSNRAGVGILEDFRFVPLGTGAHPTDVITTLREDHGEDYNKFHDRHYKYYAFEADKKWKIFRVRENSESLSQQDILDARRTRKNIRRLKRRFRKTKAIVNWVAAILERQRESLQTGPNIEVFPYIVMQDQSSPLNQLEKTIDPTKNVVEGLCSLCDEKLGRPARMKEIEVGLDEDDDNDKGEEIPQVEDPITHHEDSTDEFHSTCNITDNEHLIRLPCFHTFHSECYKSIVREAKEAAENASKEYYLKCPTCGLNFSCVNFFPKIFLRDPPETEFCDDVDSSDDEDNNLLEVDNELANELDDANTRNLNLQGEKEIVEDHLTSMETLLTPEQKTKWRDMLRSDGLDQPPPSYPEARHLQTENEDLKNEIKRLEDAMEGERTARQAKLEKLKSMWDNWTTQNKKKLEDTKVELSQSKANLQKSNKDRIIAENLYKSLKQKEQEPKLPSTIKITVTPPQPDRTEKSNVHARQNTGEIPAEQTTPRGHSNRNPLPKLLPEKKTSPLPSGKSISLKNEFPFYHPFWKIKRMPPNPPYSKGGLALQKLPMKELALPPLLLLLTVLVKCWTLLGLKLPELVAILEHKHTQPNNQSQQVGNAATTSTTNPTQTTPVTPQNGPSVQSQQGEKAAEKTTTTVPATQKPTEQNTPPSSIGDIIFYYIWLLSTYVYYFVVMCMAVFILLRLYEIYDWE